MINIGVICEGPTDYPAIVHFLGAALQAEGIKSSFRPLFPDMDNTRPIGGWANVFSWLKKYPPEARIQRFFSGGLFGGDLKSELLDAIIIQLDADVLDDSSFKNYIEEHFNITLLKMSEPNDRADQIKVVLLSAARIREMANIDVERHILLPAVESTESWCVSAFSAQPIESNRLSGIALTNAFMKALEVSESKIPNETYKNCDKSSSRREKFCLKHKDGHNRISRDSPQFLSALQQVMTLNRK